jgi:hypothetical protein
VVSSKERLHRKHTTREKGDLPLRHPQLQTTNYLIKTQASLLYGAQIRGSPFPGESGQCTDGPVSNRSGCYREVDGLIST